MKNTNTKAALWIVDEAALFGYAMAYTEAYSCYHSDFSL